MLPKDKEKSHLSLNSNESYIDTDISPNILNKINSHHVLFKRQIKELRNEIAHKYDNIMNKIINIEEELPKKIRDLIIIILN